MSSCPFISFHSSVYVTTLTLSLPFSFSLCHIKNYVFPPHPIVGTQTMRPETEQEKDDFHPNDALPTANLPMVKEEKKQGEIKNMVREGK